MKSKKAGKSTSPVEVSAVTKNGVWILVEEREYFMSYGDYPWFKDAKIEDVFAAELLPGGHLYWPKLDVDLMVDGLQDQEKYPLIAKSTGK